MTTKSSANYSTIRGCLSRYKLVLKAASRITSLDKLTCYDDKQNSKDDYVHSHNDFIISKHLTTPGNDHALHNLIFRKTSGLHKFDIWGKIRYKITFFSPIPILPFLSCIPVSSTLQLVFSFIYTIHLFIIFNNNKFNQLNTFYINMKHIIII